MLKIYINQQDTVALATLCYAHATFLAPRRIGVASVANPFRDATLATHPQIEVRDDA